MKFQESINQGSEKLVEFCNFATANNAKAVRVYGTKTASGRISSAWRALPGVEFRINTPTQSPVRLGETVVAEYMATGSFYNEHALALIAVK